MTTGTPKFAGRRGREGKVFHFKALLQSTGWIGPAFVEVDKQGIIQGISNTRVDNSLSVESVNGFAVPGFQNAHSHAFQFAMAGMAERHDAHTVDDFWSWREAMYARALTMGPDEMQAVAATLYAEMLRRGYTHVAEFQYLHHDKDGRSFNNLSEMSVSLLAAAAIAGIKITLIPVYYKLGGFGKPAEASQRRFCFQDVDQYFKLVDECSAVIRNLSNSRLGFGVHSLRAAAPDDIMRIVEGGPRGLPFHVHAAEQLKEVNDSIAFLKQRPVEWFLNHVELNEDYHLIHCTHLTDDEVVRLAKSQAHAVLCPGTEANLGDGIFRVVDFAGHSGRFSIGTDSHISLNPLEDMRWLDYTQRLTTHKRNTFNDGASVLMKNAIHSGRRAMGIKSRDFFEVGHSLDAVIYDGDSPLLKVARPEDLLSTLVYTADGHSVTGTIIDGEWIVWDGHHKFEEQILKDFESALKSISSV